MWYDRELHRFIRAIDSQDSAIIEKRLEKLGQPLIHGGSVVSSPYRAGAAFTSIMPDDINIHSQMAIIRGFGLIYRYLLHPSVFFRVGFLGVRNVLRSVLKKNRPHTMRENIDHIRTMGQQLLFSDVTRRESIRALREGQGPYFVDYVLYDEMAHEHGKTHPLALEALRQLDRDIRIMLSTVKRLHPHMRVVIFSDHGHIDAVPFAVYTHMSVSDHLAQWFGESRARYFTSSLFESADPEDAPIFSCASGSLLQIYFQHTEDHHMTDQEIEKKYPGAIERIISTPGIGGMIVRVSKTKKDLHSSWGTIHMEDGKICGEVPHTFLDQYGVTIQTIWEFAEYLMQPNSGDVVVFGGMLPNGKIIGFENQQSLHGGWFGDMMRPFIATNDDDLSRVMNRDSSLESLTNYLHGV
jgi:hypothetical protein